MFPVRSGRRFRRQQGRTIMKSLLMCGAAMTLALTVSACGGKPSAVSAAGVQATAYTPQSDGSAAYADRPSYNSQRDVNVPKVDGKPMWASNRTHTAEENAQYQFTRNGHDFGASSETDYVAKAHAFIDHPPEDIQTVDRRNGDRLLYDARQNVFAVVSSEGAPRTMFKPRGGASYWAQQKDQESQRPDRGGTSGGENQG
jgi:pyocin large subunit-like protein